MKLYSAAVDRRVHFRLLHAPDQAPLEQHMVHPETGETVARDAIRRGYATEAGAFVVLNEDEIAALEPPDSREITITQFFPAGLLGPEWYVRPYYLGADGSAGDYAALARALAEERRQGLAHWVMRKRPYTGALASDGALLALVTIRRAEEMISVAEIAPERARAPSEREATMAEQLIEMYSADYDPTQYRDEYRDRVLELVRAKARGKKPTLAKAPARRPEADLASALAASLKRARQRAA